MREVKNVMSLTKEFFANWGSHEHRHYKAGLPGSSADVSKMRIRRTLMEEYSRQPLYTSVKP